jgi:hypothetical protein
VLSDVNFTIEAGEMIVSVRDCHPRAAHHGGISGCSVDGDRCAAPYQSDMGVEIHGEFRGCTEAAVMGDKVREVSCQRTFRGEILRARTRVGEHVLLLGETIENGLGHGVVASRSDDSTSARFGDYPGRQQHT